MLQSAGKLRLSAYGGYNSAPQRHTASKNVGNFTLARSRSSASRPLTRATYLAPIYWDAPSDAVIKSHKLLLQAGFIKQVCSHLNRPSSIPPSI